MSLAAPNTIYEREKGNLQNIIKTQQTQVKLKRFEKKDNLWPLHQWMQAAILLNKSITKSQGLEKLIIRV